jgi:hypothetical protein
MGNPLGRADGKPHCAPKLAREIAAGLHQARFNARNGVSRTGGLQPSVISSQPWWLLLWPVSRAGFWCIA